MRTSRYVTDCGTPLFTIDMPGAKDIAMGVLVGVGSKDEVNPKDMGLSHAVEHMVFRGNAKFPSSDLLTGYLERVGGEINAWTSQEATFFHTLIPNRHRQRSAEYLYHLVSSPSFSPKYIPPEINNIIGEIKSRNDNPEELIKDLCHEAIFNQRPLGNSILGTVDSVSRFTEQDFIRWHQRFYYPKNFTFVVAGDIQSNPIQEFFRSNPMFRTFNRLFRDINPNIVQSPGPEKSSKRSRGPTRQITIRRHVEQIYLIVGAPIDSANAKSTRALQVFQQMLDGGMSFPLFQELREKSGVGYTVEATMTLCSKAGIFQIFAGIDPNKLKLAQKAIPKIIKTAQTSRKLFHEAQELILEDLSDTKPDPEEVLDQAAHNIVVGGEPKLASQYSAEIKAIRYEDVSAAVQQYLQPENFNEVLIVPK